MCFGEAPRDHGTHATTEFSICRDAAGNDNRAGLIFFDGAAGLLNENIEGSFLEFMADGIYEVLVVFFLLVFFEKIENGGLESGERKPIVARVDHGARERECVDSR